MTTIAIGHKVANYEAWLPHYHSLDEERTAAGCTDATIYPPAEDSGDVLVVEQWPDAATAYRFMEANDVKTLMGKAGVTSPPAFHVLGAPVEAMLRA